MNSKLLLVPLLCVGGLHAQTGEEALRGWPGWSPHSARLRSLPLPAGNDYFVPLQTGICFGGTTTGRFWFDGRLDGAAFYPHVLSAALVFAHHQAASRPAPAIPYHQVIFADNSVGDWRFNEP